MRFLWIPAAEVMKRYHIFMKLFSVAFHMNTYVTELMCAVNHEIAVFLCLCLCRLNTVKLHLFNQKKMVFNFHSKNHPAKGEQVA